MDKKWMTAIFISLVFFCENAWAQGMAFNYRDPKGVNSISIVLDSVLEPIMGVASGISGEVMFDPEKKIAIRGRIVVNTAKIQMTNPMMTKVLHSEEWLDVKQFPTVEFLFKEIVSTGSMKDMLYEYMVSGDFTCKGTTKEIQVPVNVSYLPGKLNARNGKGEGDLLILRSQFHINRKDFGIKPDMDNTSVADTIQLNVRIVGYSQKK